MSFWKKKHFIERVRLKLNIFLEMTNASVDNKTPKNKTEALLEALEIAIAVKRRTLSVRLMVGEPVTGRLFRLRPSQLPKYTNLIKELNCDTEFTEDEKKFLILKLRKTHEEIERIKVKEFIKDIKWEYVHRKYEESKKAI